MNKDRHVSLILPGVWFAIVILCGMAAAPLVTMAEPRGEIRVVESWRPDINVLGHNVLQSLFEYALDRNELAPCLALSQRMVDDTNFEIKLRTGVRFHNGERFDANAVKFNFDYQRQYNPGRGVQVYLRNIKEIQVVDPNTVRMVLHQLDTTRLYNSNALGPISGWVLGAPKYMKKVGWKEFLKRPIGTGPFVVEGEVKDYRKTPEGKAYAKLIANTDYWKKTYPKIQKVTFVQYSPSEALKALTVGRVDLVTSLIPKDTLKVATSPYCRVVKSRDDVTYTSAYLNLLSPKTMPLRNLRVREALNYAVNKEELRRYAFKGNAIQMRGLMTETSGVDISETVTYHWDIPRARELMKLAGYENGFKMSIFYQQKNELIAQLLQRFYSLIGIKATTEPINWEWIERHLVYPNTREDYSWADEDWWLLLYSNPGYQPEAMYVWFATSFHFGGPFRAFPDWLIEPLDEMYHELRRTREREERFRIYKKANEYIAKQALLVFTMAPMTLYGVNEELNFVPQMSQYLYLDYSSVTDNHWSVSGN